MLHVGLYHLFDRLPAHWTVLRASPEWLQTPLADTEMTAGQHHDTLLMVLADTAQLIFSLSLHFPQ